MAAPHVPPRIYVASPLHSTQPEAALLPPPLASSLNTSRGAPKLLPRLPSCLHPWRLALPGGTASCARLLQGVGAGHAAFHLATHRRRVAPLMPLLLLARSTLPPPAHPPPGLHTLPRGSEDTNIDPANRKCSDRIRYSTNSDPRASPHPPARLPVPSAPAPKVRSPYPAHAPLLSCDGGRPSYGRATLLLSGRLEAYDKFRWRAGGCRGSLAAV